MLRKLLETWLRVPQTDIAWDGVQIMEEGFACPHEARDWEAWLEEQLRSTDLMVAEVAGQF